MADEQRISALFPTRRNVINGLAAMSALLACPTGTAQAEAVSGYYFFPGSRIGIKRPDGLGRHHSLWKLEGQFEAFSVTAQESIRFAEEEANHLWNRDDRYLLLPEKREIDGLDTRRFRQRGAIPDGDSATEMIAMRDARWIGELTASIHPFGQLRNLPGDEKSRWRQVMQDILASVRIRPPLPIDQILAEIGIEMSVPELNPRLIGETLIFSTYNPTNAQEAWGANYPTIRSSSVMILPPGTPAEQEKLNTLQEAMISKLPGATALNGQTCRAVLGAEHEITQGAFGRSMDIFGQTRRLNFTAYYDDGRRREMNDALRKILHVISLA